MADQAKDVRISVRNLVEFLLREGDIDNRIGGMADKEAMLAGGRAHRRIQGRMGSEYRAEVLLRDAIDRDGYQIILEGRADGIFSYTRYTDDSYAVEDGEEIFRFGSAYEETCYVIDEIKSMYMDPARLEEPIPVHLAQAKCYAAIFTKQNDIPAIGVQMTYVNLDTEEERRFRLDYAREEILTWYGTLMEEYGKWTDFERDWRMIRNESIANTEFPFVYRPGQEQLCGFVERIIEEGRRGFVQAPTGVGKTMSNLFPAIKALGEEKNDKIFYLTAKTVTARAAEHAFEVLSGLRLKRTFLTAKEKICPLDEMDCNPVHCPYAKGHYDRVNAALFDFIQSHDHASAREITDFSRERMVCPFEFSLDVSLWSDAVVCDYNYAFSPNVRLKRYFGDGEKGGYIFLVDEAHNLVERGRDMFSATLIKEEFLRIRKLAKPYSTKLVRELNRCNTWMLERKRACEGYEILSDISDLLIHLLRLSGILDEIFEDDKAPEIREELTEFYFQIYHFLDMAERLDEKYLIYTFFDEDGNFCIREFCVDPSGNLREVLDKGNAAVFFSATLLPVNYYKELLSGDVSDFGFYARSPFDPNKRLLMIGEDVTTRYTRRNQAEYEKAAGYICRIISKRKGNYLAFFPSYKYMQNVREHLERMLDEDTTILAQSSSMSEAGRAEFLENFNEGREDTLLGLGVLGGIFSEGIDLTGDRLIGVIVLGTGLPFVCEEREILRNYYEEKSGNGFAFAYLYPGMNKVMQAAGRVIRTEDDRGVIALLDDRFLTSTYRAAFPLEWREQSVCRMEQAGDLVQEFWDK